MRGRIDQQGEIYHTFHLEDLVPGQHPLRAIKARADRVLADMSARFSRAYAAGGRRSIPPERLIKALLLQALFSIRSEIQLCEQIQYNMLFRWFLDMTPSETVWTPEVFSINRARFDEHDLVRDFFDRVVREALLDGLVSGDHFSVDGTLIQSFASMKSLRPIGTTDTRVRDGAEDDDPGNPTVHFRGERRSNATHRSIVDPQARLMRKGKGKPALLSHSAHVLMENRNGLCVDVAVDEANGTAERRCAGAMLHRALRSHGLWPRTLGTDAAYADGEFLDTLEAIGIIPHTPVGDKPIVARDRPGQARLRAQGRARTKGYALSQRMRKRVEEIFGWCKTIGSLARARFVGRWKIKQQAEVTGAAYNLLRLARLQPAV
jgi:transposase